MNEPFPLTSLSDCSRERLCCGIRMRDGYSKDNAKDTKGGIYIQWSKDIFKNKVIN